MVLVGHTRRHLVAHAAIAPDSRRLFRVVDLQQGTALVIGSRYKDAVVTNRNGHRAVHGGAAEVPRVFMQEFAVARAQHHEGRVDNGCECGLAANFDRQQVRMAGVAFVFGLPQHLTIVLADRRDESAKQQVDPVAIE
jgi:hypothetical protein